MKQLGFRIVENDPRVDAPSTPPAARVDLSRLMAAARRQRQVMMLSAAAGLGLGLVHLATTPGTFVGSTTILLASQPRDVPAMDSTATEAALETAAEVIRSQAVALAVVNRLDPTTTAAFLNRPVAPLTPVIEGAKQILGAPLRLMTPAPADDAATPDSHGLRLAAARSLARDIRVSRLGQSSVLSIAYASQDRALSAAVANAYAEASAADILNAHVDTTERTRRWLQDRLAALQTAADETAIAAGMVRAEHGALPPRDARLTVDLALAAAKAARAEALTTTLDSILARGPAALRSDPGTGLDDPRLAAMQGELAVLTARLARIERDFGKTHPQALRMSEQVTAQADRLFAEIRRLHDAARDALSAATAEVQALRDRPGLAVDTTPSAGRQQTDLMALEQRAASLQAQYQTVLARLQEVDRQGALPVANVRILSTAEVSQTSAPPGALAGLLAMLALGGLAGAALGVLREWRHRFLRTAQDVQADMGLPFLGFLPRTGTEPDTPPAATVAPGTGMPVVATPIHALRHPASAYAETLRAIRFASELSLAGKSQIVIGVTSVLPGEGKSTVALNLAGVLAAAGHSVLLIDCDPRNPGLSRRLGITAGDGLIEAALGRADWTKTLRVLGDSGVHLLPCVTPGLTSHSAELLASKGMRQLLASARARYSHVVLDLAPLGPVVDARVMVRMADQTVLVAEWGKTPKALLREVLADDPTLIEKTLGVVLNKVDMASGREDEGKPQGDTPAGATDS